MSGFGQSNLTFVRGINFHIVLVDVNSALLFFLELDDGFSSGVVNIKFLGNLHDKLKSYIDDAPSILNALEQFGADLLSHLFILFGGCVMLHVDGFHFAANQLDLERKDWRRGVFCKMSSHFYLIIL